MKYSWGGRSGDAIWCKLNLNDNKMPCLLEKKFCCQLAAHYKNEFENDISKKLKQHFNSVSRKRRKKNSS